MLGDSPIVLYKGSDERRSHVSVQALEALQPRQREAAFVQSPKGLNSSYRPKSRLAEARPLPAPRSGLVATGALATPFELADIVTTTTHKSLRGPRAGMIFFRRALEALQPRQREAAFVQSPKVLQRVCAASTGSLFERRRR
ncbi:Serine hydroxymethyltransferase, mitochondrial [Tetrabaena socialis]|uniref:Serine hydroxymethyltransferase, mitochondrial n=1 Tax=Tetrabaena socialis TaxID=47790 RepID=A0A2J8A127_9CHLO|nr:Serine hydroxymethyltransferase, mitochondrial [Tetrabaena socialis]|eukprot:PNH06214.1 Serine hydroxymethyltransferase, mitochondrial [Tetrabaena socialis]